MSCDTRRRFVIVLCNGAGEAVGKLYETDDGTLAFEGQLDESAKSFARAVREIWEAERDA